ncbi:MAG: sodium:solute symporter family transporter [Candidatus Hydrogenedentota bacterium]
MTTRYRRIALCLCLAGLALGAGCAPNPAALDEELRNDAVDTLRAALDDAERWQKVHAAEALLKLSYPDGVLETFEAELEAHAAEPEYRVGIWRVLAQAELTEVARNEWADKIRAVWLDPNASDRLHAIESLAKLGRPLDEAAVAKAEPAAASGQGPMAAYALWALANTGKRDAGQALAALLGEEDPATRSAAAYALRHLPVVPPPVAAQMSQAAEAEPSDSPAHIYLVSAAWCLAEEGASNLKGTLREYATTGTTSQRYEALNAFAKTGGMADVPWLTGMLEAPEADVRIGSASAILRIGRRVPKRMAVLDWVVIAAYMAAMVGVGWYYARRITTRDDYLLGGRTMRPFAVGLSMFASLLSTITYLSVPGEMIKHGPMIVGKYVVYPLLFVAIGWLIIPFIMRLKITSAYEILEQRLGLSVRMLGSFFFLALRLMWMAVIIYATSSAVLVPMLGWPQTATPVVCAVLGLVTVVYTSMGGIRAVVMTDVVQTLILFGGAGLTLAIITLDLGGVGAWWPTEWSPQWDPLKFGYDPNARITVMGAMIAGFAWHFCTAGSDQVAIQRYLSTRDAKSARRVVAVSLITDITVGTFLAILGLALFAYFAANPHLMPDTHTIGTNADTLFPRFIIMSLPMGITGLVVAGLLAAAMSSLSSGVNSSCSVISVDFLDRFGGSGERHTAKWNVNRDKWVSVVVGVVVVLMSAGVNYVGGNLLEVTFKVVNLLTAPLFVLFFMALFIPWGTAPASFIAGVVSAVVAIGVGYFNWFGLSFIWIMPLSLLAGVVVGPLLSLLPIGMPAHKKNGES